ncbi:Cleavage and polyadenylation specificity factor subunit 3 [Podochytrium sp. JEL0797]|nr:Cleavage and polyadenylation specificity factor subunit 3 [Podochytrium sp. JEL0797]
MKRPLPQQQTASDTAAAQDAADILRITPLGAGQEVGRSCLLLEYKNKTVMLDCGLHPAYSGLAALPFFDNIDPSTIDVLLLTHFHIDHAAALPYFMEKTTFKGRVFMTHPTKAIFKWLLADYVKVSNLAVDDMLYDEKDLLRAYDKIETIDFHQQVDVEGIKFTPYNAGHVLGAAMFLIEIAGVRVLYTGDYSREEDRHLMAAERPPNVIPEVLIAESTYGVQHHRSRIERETIFTQTIHQIVARGGRCLVPVFALGRAQELLLILDEYWQAHPELHNVPIYYASALAKKCMTVFQTFSNMMNARIRQQTKSGQNPFQFKHISNLKSMNYFDDVGPCVMMASPGMLQNGQSRELLELWCPDKRNGVIIPGYVVEGTLGKQILSQPEEIMSLNGTRLPLRLTVEYVSFSAHVDYPQNSQFIEEVGAQNLILVHGEQNQMGRLKSALASKYQESESVLNIFTPKNCEAVELYFKGEKMAKAMGTLAKHPLKQNTRVEGVLVSKDFTYRLIEPSDLPEFTDLVSATLSQRLVISSRAPLSLVRWHLEAMYGPCAAVEEDDDAFMVFGTVKVKDLDNNRLLLEWDGNSVTDMVADSVLAIVLQAESSPASVKATRSAHKHSHGDEEDHDHDHDDLPEKEEADDIPSTTEKPSSSDPSPEDKESVPPPSSPAPSDGSDTEFEEIVTHFFKQQFGESGVELVKKGGEESVGDDEMKDDAEEEVAEQKSQQQPPARRSWKVKIDNDVAGIVLARGKAPVIETSSDELHRRVSSIAGRVKKTLDPISKTWKPAGK